MLSGQKFWPEGLESSEVSPIFYFENNKNVVPEWKCHKYEVVIAQISIFLTTKNKSYIFLC